jgi:peptidoglycan/LPS O-acetylase OafA/YrhL
MADSRIAVSRPSRSAGYLPTLDGWRTISIISVMLCHGSIYQAGLLDTKWFYLHGYLGVDVFFAISGLLICSRLLNEEQAKGTINMRNFYVRRMFRIIPPAIFFLLTLLVLKWTVHLRVGVPEVLASILFVRNYSSFYSHFQTTIYPFYTSHFWSLAIEEHFYLILPALLVFINKKWRVPALFTLAVLVGLNRMSPGSWHSMHTSMRIDALIVPAMIAVLIRRAAVRDWLTRWLRWWPLLAAIFLVPVTFDLIPRTTGLLVAWLMPFLILGTMLRPQSWFSRFLELPGMRYVGRLSYSLYLWQQLFFIAHFGSGASRLGALQSWPLCIVMTFICALFSFYFIEQPFIRMGHRLAPNVAANKVARSEAGALT